MHSSRMRTICCRGCWGDVSQHALGSGWCVSQHALGVCLGGVCRGRMFAQGSVCHTTPTPLRTESDACENITLPQLRCGR